MDARTANRAVRDLVAALNSLGIASEPALEDGEPLVRIVRADSQLDLPVLALSAPSAATLETHLRRRRGRLVVVADRLSAQGRGVLNRRGAGWLDRRGHLRILLPDHGFIVDSSIPSTAVARSSEALTTPVGQEVAVELLVQPSKEWGVRELAGVLGRSPSTVSIALRDLRARSLVDGRSRPLPTMLFETLVEHWSPKTSYVATLPTPNLVTGMPRLHANLDELEDEGWALTDALAAAGWNARLPVTKDYPPDLYVPDTGALAYAVDRFGLMPTATGAAARLLVAPVRRAIQPRFGAQLAMFGDGGWPLTHPLFAALEIARDPGRGPEVLASWTPPTPFVRVW